MVGEILLLDGQAEADNVPMPTSRKLIHADLRVVLALPLLSVWQLLRLVQTLPEVLLVRLETTTWLVSDLLLV